MGGISSNSARRVRKGATLPATCSPGDVFLKESGGSEGLYICITANTWVLLDAAAGDGTVTSVSVVTANGLSGTVANPTTTPAITLDVSGLDATKIADGSVSNAEFQRLDATSSIQTQLNSKAADADVVHDTGDETIAGVKTFSSDPIIPDEAYGVGWNGSLEPPTKNAVYDKIETAAPAARVYHNVNQSITNATTTTLAFNSEREDNDAIHDTATNNSRLTCKTAGLYYIYALINFAPNGTGGRSVDIVLNNTTPIGYDVRPGIPGGFFGTALVALATWRLGVNDYVEAKVYQDSGGALNVLTIGNSSPEFGMIRLSS